MASKRRLTPTGWATIAVFGALGVLVALATLVAAPRWYRATAQMFVSGPRVLVPIPLVPNPLGDCGFCNPTDQVHPPNVYPPDSAVVRHLRATINTPGTVVVRPVANKVLLDVEATSSNRIAAARLANAMAQRVSRFVENGSRKQGMQVRATVIYPATVPAAPVGPNWAWLWVGLGGGLIIGIVISLARLRVPRHGGMTAGYFAVS